MPQSSQPATLHTSLGLASNEVLRRQSSTIIHREDPTSETLLYERLKRSAKNEDHDEVEIPVDSVLQDQPNTGTVEPDSQSSTTLVDGQSTVLQSITIEPAHSMSTWHVRDDETTSVNSTFVQQETDMLNQTDERTTASVVDGRLLYPTTEIDQHDADVLVNSTQFVITESNSSSERNGTSPEISLLNLADVPQANESQSSFSSTEDERLRTATPQFTDSEATTEFDNHTDENGTNSWHFVSLNDSTTFAANNDSSNLSILQTDVTSVNQTLDEDTASSNLTVKMADVSDTSVNEIIKDANETSSLPSSWTSTSIPVCDQSCQCSMECPYGFEILNDTCQCNPPCQVSD